MQQQALPRPRKRHKQTRMAAEDAAAMDAGMGADKAECARVAAAGVDKAMLRRRDKAVVKADADNKAAVSKAEDRADFTVAVAVRAADFMAAAEE